MVCRVCWVRTSDAGQQRVYIQHIYAVNPSFYPSLHPTIHPSTHIGRVTWDSSEGPEGDGGCAGGAVDVNSFLRGMQVCVRTSIHAHTHLFLYVWMAMRFCGGCRCAYFHIYMHTRMHTYMHTRTHACIHSYTHMRTCMHTYIHSHMCIHSPALYSCMCGRQCVFAGDAGVRMYVCMHA